MLSGSETSQFFTVHCHTRFFGSAQNDTCAVIRVFAKAQLQLREESFLV